MNNVSLWIGIYMQYLILICLIFLCSCTTHESAQQRGYVITHSQVESEAAEVTEVSQP